MRLRTIINSPFGIGLALIVGRILPPGIGFWLSDRVGAMIASLINSEQVTAIRANQWVVAQGKLTKKQLNQVTKKVFQSTARCLFDFYHNLHNPSNIRHKVQIMPELQKAFDRSQNGEGGFLIVAPHTSNFYLAIQAMALEGWCFLALSYPNPGKGYQWQNQFRQKGGVEIIPFSIEALRKAKESLRRGRVVITGVDRPVAGSNYHPKFFGRSSDVPVAYIRLALEVNVPIMVVACLTQSDGSYIIHASDFIWMQPQESIKTSLETNAERVLALVEKYIQMDPYQWSMPYAVWPEALNEVNKL